MDARKRERGGVLVLSILLMLLIGALLSGAAAMACRVTASLHDQVRDEDALVRARGGVRWAAALLEGGAKPGALILKDEAGTLEVRIEGERIVSTYTFHLTPAREMARSVSARWERAGTIELSGWKEE